MEVLRPSGDWRLIPIARIEDLSDAVYGAGLEAIQMSTGRLSGDIAFAEKDGILCSSGLIGGRVALLGPLSQNMVTLGVGLSLAGSRHWLNEVDTGAVGVFLPADEHDALYPPGSMYATVTLTEEKLDEEAARDDLILDRKVLGGTGIHARKLLPGMLARFQQSFGRIHGGRTNPADADVGAILLRTLIDHLARSPHPGTSRTRGNYHARIVERARGYILENLCEPMSVDDIAAAAFTSRRTLFRAFTDILDDTPRDYVRRVRLHRIRYDLASDAEKACTIALIANQWGISDLGRMAGWYRQLFGERPSETLAYLLKMPNQRLARTT